MLARLVVAAAVASKNLIYAVPLLPDLPYWLIPSVQPPTVVIEAIVIVMMMKKMMMMPQYYCHPH